MAVGTSAPPPESDESDSPAALAVSVPSSPEVGDELAAEELVVEDALFFLAFFDALALRSAFAFFFASVFVLAFSLAFDVLDALASLDALDEAAEDEVADDCALPAPEEVDPPAALLCFEGPALFEPELFGDPPPFVAVGAADVGWAGLPGLGLGLGFGFVLGVCVGFGLGAFTLGGAVLGAAPEPRRKPTTVPGCGLYA